MEELENIAFTTINVIDNRKTITHIVHDEDGDWQFFSADDNDLKEEDARVVGLHQILALDPSLKDITVKMPKNTEAERANAEANWEIIQQ